jgi:hypothetical protein
MPLDLSASAPTLLIRRAAFERAGLARTEIDARYNLTPDEFRVEGELIAIGPLVEEDAVGDLIEQFEGAGLTYFDDFFELSGNWPDWCRVYVRGAE